MTPIAPTPQSLALRGVIELIGPDQAVAFAGCLDNRWLGGWGGFEHGDSGHAVIQLAADTETARAGRLEPGRHELAIAILVPYGPINYSTATSSRINIIEPETDAHSTFAIFQVGGRQFEELKRVRFAAQ